MLNQYHLRFLAVLDAHRVRYLIIGGQARLLHHGVPTRDLDIWADSSPDAIPALRAGLLAWHDIVPHHFGDFFDRRSVPLRPNVQIHLPTADMLMMGDDGEHVSVPAADGIDVLTSQGDFSFSDFYERAHVVDGRRYVSIADLESTSRLKAANADAPVRKRLRPRA